jgi:hypothetical protein
LKIVTKKAAEGSHGKSACPSSDGGKVGSQGTQQCRRDLSSSLDEVHNKNGDTKQYEP